jgi:hypothetical protein
MIASINLRQVPALLRGESEFLRAWSMEWSASRLAFCLTVIVTGAGLYGAAMGCWRSPLQAAYVALKFPIILGLTATGNALLNGMLAPLLGLNLGFRQSFLAILTSFAIASAILGSFAPLAAFMVWNAQPMVGDLRLSGGTYSFFLLMHVGLIAFAGIAANLRLVQFLRAASAGAPAAHRVLLAWLAGNLFLGSQVCWILRPFIGSPDLPVEFLRDSAFHGNFYEAVFHAFNRVLSLD